MKITKAIELLEIETGSRHIPSDPDLHDAIQLGIEALKLIQDFWTQLYVSPIPLCPDETEEENETRKHASTDTQGD